jgi:excisionase family DNA binding protein
MPVPVCRTVQDAYDAGRADALAGLPAAKIAELIVPLLEQIAAQRAPRLLTIAQAAEQLGLNARTVYDLVYKGDIASVQIPPRAASKGEKLARRIEQAEIDAFIARNRVTGITTHGGG